MNTTTPSVEQATLFILSGGGDTDFFLAPPSALEWCEQVRPGQRTLPDTVAEQLKPFLDPKGDLESINEPTHITTGSADNDAALFLSCLVRHFDTAAQALNYATRQGWKVTEEEYHGCIY